MAGKGLLSMGLKAEDEVKIRPWVTLTGNPGAVSPVVYPPSPFMVAGKNYKGRR
jgi:hypothetical protein